MGADSDVGASRRGNRILAKQDRIRRTDCGPEPSLSSEPLSLVEATYFEKLEAAYENPLSVNRTDLETAPLENPEADGCREDNAFEFRLFSRSSQARDSETVRGAPQRIQLRSPTPECGDPGFLVSRRPASYYFSGHSSEQHIHEYAQAAISGKDILNLSKMKWVRTIDCYEKPGLIL